MSTVNDFNRYGKEFEQLLFLRTSPVAVKMIKAKTDIPKGTIIPTKDRNYHIAQCQAFGMSRRERISVVMLKEDNWCPAPCIAYGLVPHPEDPAWRRREQYDCFEYGKYIGILTAPLRSAKFEPDVIIVYLDTNQLRSTMLAMKLEDRDLVEGRFFPPSCAYAVTTPILSGHYLVVLPDPGEYTRALTIPGEMMLAIPGHKLAGLISDIREYEKNESGFAHENMIMRPDFPQPDFYKRMFESWGIQEKINK